MNPRVQNKRLKRIENRPHYRLKNEQKKLDKLIFNQHKDYTYSYDFLDEFERICNGRGFDAWLNYHEFACKYDFFTGGLEPDMAVILKFFRENLKAFQFDNELAVSVHYSTDYRINKTLNDQAFVYLDQLSSTEISQLVNAIIIPLTRACNNDREETNNQELGDLLNCIVKAVVSDNSGNLDDIIYQNWHHIVDEHNQKLKQR